MAGGLLSRFSSRTVHLDHITIAGQTVEFRHVFYTWPCSSFLSSAGLCAAIFR